MEIPEPLIQGLTRIANKNLAKTTLYGKIEEWQTREILEAMMMLLDRLQNEKESNGIRFIP